MPIRNLLRRLLPIALGLLASTLTCFSQPMAAQGPDQPLSARERRAVVTALARQLGARYVLPEAAAQVQRELLRRLIVGEYDQLTSSRELAKTLTIQLLALTHDKHLGVYYQPQPQPQPVAGASAGPPAPAGEQAAARRYASSSNYGFVRAERLPGNVGYLRLDEFVAAALGAETATAALTYLSHTDALILDLRYNHGGEPDMVAHLASYLFGVDSVHLNDLYQRASPQPRITAYWTHPGRVAGPRYGAAKPVYVLTSRRTFSAGEECAYDLQALRRATIVGETTAGGANPGEPVRLSEHFTAFIPTEQARNPLTHTNWEGTGVQPDVATTAEQALSAAYLAALRHLSPLATDDWLQNERSKAIRQLEAAASAAPR